MFLCRGLEPRWDMLVALSCWDFLIVISLLIDLGLETDATEDDFGVWEVKTMVAVILHLLEGPSGKVPFTTFHFSGLGECLPITASKFPSPFVSFPERPQGESPFVTSSSPSTVLFLQSLVGRPPSTRPY